MNRPSYPYCCRSICCGETTCPPDCANLPALVAYHEAKAAWLRERMEQAEAEADALAGAQSRAEALLEEDTHPQIGHLEPVTTTAGWRGWD